MISSGRKCGVNLFIGTIAPMAVSVKIIYFLISGSFHRRASIRGQWVIPPRPKIPPVVGYFRYYGIFASATSRAAIAGNVFPSSR
jgi:hypothetical protein